MSKRKAILATETIEEIVPQAEEEKATEMVTTTEEVQATLNAYNELTTKSSKIKFLAKQGMSVKQIKDIVGIRYQHVYNTLSAAGMLPEKTNGSGVNCKVCSRELTREQSVKNAIGPICRHKMNGTEIGIDEYMNRDFEG